MPRTRETSERKQRTPLGSPRSKLTVPQREGYVRRFVNDTPGRLEQAQEGGYEFVTEDVPVGDAGDGNSDVGSKVSIIAGRNEDGSPMRAYLMEIKKEWYEEDQQEKQRVVDETDQAIREGKLKEFENSYVPQEGIKYGTK